MTQTQKKAEEVESLIVRFAGDSGDGMQLSGLRFATVSAMQADQVITATDFPAEIRAPAGSLYGVSAFQLGIGSGNIHTAGDEIDVLVAMNPAALKTNLHSVRAGGIIITDRDAYSKNNLKKAAYESNPLDDESLSKFRVLDIELTRLTRNALTELKMGPKDMDRCRNFYALGVVSWIANSSLEPTIKWVENKFKSKPQVAQANILALKAGHIFADVSEEMPISYTFKENKGKEKGTYRYLNGNTATALGLITAAQKANLHLYLGTYPITPASDILHELVKYRNYNVTTFQAEDELSAIGSAIGAAFAGSLAVTTSSGPGIALKSEFINLALMTELPLIIINIQRGGPSTGLPTKLEQADLLQALYGRNGESPLIVLAASSPKDCFEIAYEAARLTIKYMTPVILLTDGYMASGSEPWKIPDPDEIPEIPVNFVKENTDYLPYARDKKTFARSWAKVGTPGLEHRIGGLEKTDLTGDVDFSPLNHEKMVGFRQEKINRVVQDIPAMKAEGNPNAKILVLGWGSPYGAIRQACENLNASGKSVAFTCIRYLNPFPADFHDLLKKYEKVLLPENNLGQLAFKIKGELFFEVISLTKVQGIPFKVSEIENKVNELLKDLS